MMVKMGQHSRKKILKVSAEEMVDQQKMSKFK